MGGTHHTLTYRAEYKTGGTWTAFPGLLEIDTVIESGTGVSPFQFGGATLPRATVRCGPSAPATGWRWAPFRAWHSVAIDGAGAVEERVFSGFLTRREPSAEGWTFTAGGPDAAIAKAEVRMPLRYRRPLATRTTLTSVENPATIGATPGLLNEIFWRAGGRPYEQAAAYEDADWYYACDGSSVAPEWSWVDGENPWSEALALAEAAGGQIYMDTEGVVRYVNPLKLAEEAAAIVVADTGPAASGRILFDGALEIRENVEEAYNVAICAYQRRALQPAQEVYKAQYPVPPVAASAVVELPPLTTQWPVLWRDLQTGETIYSLEVKATRSDGSPVTLTPSVSTEAAQRLVVSVTNPLAEPIQVSEVTVHGRPVAVIHEGEARYAGAKFDANEARDITKRLPDNIYTQSQSAAERRAQTAVLFEGVPRRVFGVQGCAFEPGVHVGGYATLSSERYGLAAIPCRIIARRLEDSGARMALTLAEVTGLPRLSELWVVGQTYADGDVRKMGL